MNKYWKVYELKEINVNDNWEFIDNQQTSITIKLDIYSPDFMDREDAIQWIRDNKDDLNGKQYVVDQVFTLK